MFYTTFILTFCFVDNKDIKSIFRIITNIYATVLLGILIVSNFKVFKVIKRQRKDVVCVNAGNRDQLQQRVRERKRSYVMALLVITFMGCIFPYLVASNLLKSAKLREYIGSYSDLLAIEFWTELPSFLNNCCY